MLRSVLTELLGDERKFIQDRDGVKGARKP